MSEATPDKGEPPSRLGALLGPATWLGLAPAWAFLLGQVFENGFAATRGIPSQVISVRPESIAVAVFALVLAASLLLGFWYYSDRARALFPERLRELRRVSHPWLMLLAMVGVGLYFFFGVSAAAVAIGVGSVLMTALTRLEWGHSAWERLSAKLRYELENPVAVGLALFFVFLASVWIARLAGQDYARNQSIYWVYEDPVTHTEMVLLRSYGDTIVAAELNREASTIGPVYRVIEASGIGVPFRSERLGELTTAEPSER